MEENLKTEQEEDNFFEQNFYNDELNNPLNELNREGQAMDYNTFKLRNDPNKLLHELKLSLMHAYEIKEPNKDSDGKITYTTRIKRKKNTQPRVNKKGVEEIIDHLKKFVNNHVVQGNTINQTEFQKVMRYESKATVRYYISKRRDWDATLTDISEIITTSVSLMHFFLTRTLFDKERDHYSASFQEITNVTKKPEEQKSGIFDRMSRAAYQGLGGSKY